MKRKVNTSGTHLRLKKGNISGIGTTHLGKKHALKLNTKTKEATYT
jgi:hypothetical protein